MSLCVKESREKSVWGLISWRQMAYSISRVSSRQTFESLPMVSSGMVFNFNWKSPSKQSAGQAWAGDCCTKLGLRQTGKMWRTWPVKRSLHQWLMTTLGKLRRVIWLSKAWQTCYRLTQRGRVRERERAREEGREGGMMIRLPLRDCLRESLIHPATLKHVH